MQKTTSSADFRPQPGKSVTTGNDPTIGLSCSNRVWRVPNAPSLIYYSRMIQTDLPAVLGGNPAPAGPPTGLFPTRMCVERSKKRSLTALGKIPREYVGVSSNKSRRTTVDRHSSLRQRTLAVEMALRALKVGPGQEVILAAYDYPGNFLTVHALGALPVLIDVATNNWNLDPSLLEHAWTPATRAIVVSHLHGGMAPMQEVMAFARAHDVSVVEDVAQAPGATVDGKRAGTWGDVAVWSFGGSKLLTAGRGGVIMSRHADVLQRARVWAFRGNLVGPLSELQAAVLLPQLDQLDVRNLQRADHVRFLNELLADIPGLRPFANKSSGEPAYYKLGWQFDARQFGLTRQCFVAALRVEGIAVDEGFRAQHLGRSPQRFRLGSELGEAERASAGCVILHHPVLLGNKDDVRQVAEAAQVYTHAGTLASSRDIV